MADGRDTRTPTKKEAKETAVEILDFLRWGEPTSRKSSGHRFCSNCFRILKEIEPPKPEREFHDRWGGETTYSSDGMDVTKTTVRYEDSPETAEAAIGFAHPTEHAQTGEVVKCESSTRPEPILRTGMVCECGATDRWTTDRPLSQERAVDFAENLSETIDILREKFRGAPNDRMADRYETWRHSSDVLVNTVRALKKRPDMQGHKPIFEAALAVSLRRPDEY